MRISLVSALLLLSACSESAPFPGVPIVPTDTALMDRIAAAEEARNADSPALAQGIESKDPKSRRRVAVAFGRILNPACIDPLLKLVRDENPLVKRTALFSMGQFGWTAHGAGGREKELLQAAVDALQDGEESVRVRAVEAIGKLGLEEAPTLVLPAMQDRVVAVRSEALLALFRWRQTWRVRNPDREKKSADLPNDAVLAIRVAAEDKSPEVRWRAAYVIARTPEKRAASSLKLLANDTSTWARLFTMVAVGSLKDKALADLAAVGQNDTDANVRYAAVMALKANDRTDLVSHGLAKDPSHHVRTALAETLSGKSLQDEATLVALSGDPSLQVQAAALITKIMVNSTKYRSDVTGALASRHVVLREAGVQAAAKMDKAGYGLLELAIGDRDEGVRCSVLSVLGESQATWAYKTLKAALVSKGLAERATAVEAIGKRKETGVETDLAECYAASAGREWVEVRETIVDSLATRKTTNDLLKTIAEGDPAPSVRLKAVGVLKTRGVTDIAEPKPEPWNPTPHTGLRFTKNPVVVLETTRGTIEIECAAQEAQIHVANFVGLAEAGKYDGLRWHRVVSNFVIQGGDPMGNGMGDAGWHLRHEFNEMPYDRGTVAMPRSAGLDTGGCQIFITHIPTPHLGTQYTAFGRVIAGLDVVDRIEVGDIIKKATVRR